MTQYRYAYVDLSLVTVVVACRSCHHWSDILSDRASAYRAKTDHDERVHGVEPARAAAAKNIRDSSGAPPKSS